MSVQFLSSRSGASSLQADPSPILGGDLDANGHAITGVSQLAIGVGSAIADLYPFSVYQPDDNDVWYAFQGGLTQPVRRYFAWFDHDAVDANSKKWLMGVGNSNSFILFNAGNAVHPFYVYDDAVGGVGGVTVVNSSQAQAVRINYFGVGETALGSGGLEVYSGGLTPKLWGRLANNELQIHDQSAMAAGVGGELELWGRIYTDMGTVLFPSCRIKAKKENANNADSKTRLAFSTTTSGGSPTEKVWIDSNGRVAIAAAEFNPSRFLHIQGTDYTAHARVENIAAGSWTSFRTELPGWEIVCGNATTGWLVGGLKFYSTDTSFTTTNPKLLGGLDGRVTQAYDADTKGGFAVDLVVTDNTPGTAAAPKPIFAAEGSAGTAVGDRPRCIRLFDPDDGSTNYYTGGWATARPRPPSRESVRRSRSTSPRARRWSAPCCAWILPSPVETGPLRGPPPIRAAPARRSARAWPSPRIPRPMPYSTRMRPRRSPPARLTSSSRPPPGRSAAAWSTPRSSSSTSKTSAIRRSR